MAGWSKKLRCEKIRFLIIMLDLIGIILSCVTANLYFLFPAFAFLFSLLFNGMIWHFSKKEGKIALGPDVLSRPRGYSRVLLTDDDEEEQRADRAALTPTSHDGDSDSDGDHKKHRLHRWAKSLVTIIDIALVPCFIICHIIAGIVGVSNRNWPGMVAIETGTICMFVSAAHAFLAFIGLKSVFHFLDHSNNGFVAWKINVPAPETSIRPGNENSAVVTRYHCSRCNKSYVAVPDRCAC